MPGSNPVPEFPKTEDEKALAESTQDILDRCKEIERRMLNGEPTRELAKAANEELARHDKLFQAVRKARAEEAGK